MNVRLVNPSYPSDQLKASILAILNSVELCSMSTITPTSSSYIHTAYFCYSDALDLYFISNIDATHSKNLVRSPTMAVTVFDTNQPWDSLHRGLQLFGKARIAGITESVKALAIHAARFHAYGEYIKAINPLEREAMPYKFYIFRPDSIKIFDEKEFGEETFILAQVVRE
jgi:hypothetical protein